MKPHSPTTTVPALGIAFRWVTLVLVLAFPVFSVSAGDDDDDDGDSHRRTVPLNLLPPPVATTLTTVASGMKVTEAERHDGTISYFEFNGTLAGTEIELQIRKDGTLVEIDYDSDLNHQQIPVSSLPPGVVTAVTTAYPNCGIEKTTLSRINGLDLYEIEGSSGHTPIEIYVTGAGVIIGHGLDTDHDGLPDAREPFYGCSPEVADSDGDLFPDGYEIARGSDPANAAATPQVLGINLEDGDSTGSECVVLSVSTFQGGLFEIEHCSNARDWMSLGISIVGNNQTQEVVIPIDESGECGYFRVAVSAGTVIMEAPIGGGIGTSATVFTPDDLEGTDFDLELDEDGEKELQFDGGGRGQVVDRDGQRIEMQPFTYRYKRTSASTATVTVIFPRPGQDVVVEYELEFTADGKGKIVKSTSQGGDSGSFRYRNRR